MPDSRFGCRPWICSSVTTETGASASIAFSSVFEAATVMVSSDCTALEPACAFAFMTAAEGACACCSGCAGFFLACFGFFCSVARAESVSAVCVSADVENITTNESADAPKTKARECLAPKAICPNLMICFLGSAGGRCNCLQQLAGYQLVHGASHPLTPLSSWLRRSAGTVNRRNRHFISIVNCRRWIARQSNYTK